MKKSVARAGALQVGFPHGLRHEKTIFYRTSGANLSISEFGFSETRARFARTPVSEHQLRTTGRLFPNETKPFMLAQGLRMHPRITCGRTWVQTRRTLNQTNKDKLRGKHSMKIKQVLAICGVAASLCLSLQAQDNGGNGGDQGGQGGGRRRGQGGGQQGGGGNFDPAQFQQRMMDRVREQLGFTNDTDWSAVEPLVQKVSEARMAVGFGGGFGGRGGRGGPGGQGGGGFGPANPERDALQKAIDDNAPSGQIKDALAKYKAAHKTKQAKLEAAQAELKKVLSVKQEAQATLLGLVQ